MNVNLTSSPPGRIGILANSAWNIFHFRAPLVRMWKEAGIEVVLLAPPLPQGRQLPTEWIDFKWVWLNHLTPYSSSPFDFFRGYRQLLGCLRELNLEQLYSFTVKPNILAVLAGRALNIHVVPTVTGMGSVWILGGWRRQVLKMLLRISFRSTQTVIFHNQDDLDAFVQNKLIPSATGRVISGSGLDVDYYYPLMKPEGCPFTVLYLGRYLIDKGMRELMEAAATIKKDFPDVRFLFIGNKHSANPSAMPQQEVTAWEQTGLVECLDEQADVREWIAQSDVVILPSWGEGMPRSLLEAMSMERPVITTRVPGCRQLVECGGVGWMIPVKDPNAIDAAIRDAMAHSPEQRAVMGRCARLRVMESYSEEIIAAEYGKLSQPEPAYV